MRSFTAVLSIATLAFTALTSAAPVDLTSLPVVGGVVNTVDNTVGPLVGDLGVKRDAQRGVQAILIDVQTQLQPITDKLTFCTVENATVSALTPVFNDLTTVLGSVVSEVQGLVGQPAEIILASATGTVQLTVVEVAQIVANVMTLVFTALGAVLKVVGGDVAALQPLLNAVGHAVFTLLNAVLTTVGSVVGGLLSAVVGLIQTVVPIVLQLNLNEVISLLGL